MQDSTHLFKPRRTFLSSTPKKWKDFFIKYLISKTDLAKLWELISLKVLNLLLKEGIVVLPNVGTLEVRIKKIKRYVKAYNDVIYFVYPRSELVFTPHVELRKIFDKKYFSEDEIRQLEDGKLDWMKKSGESKYRYVKKKVFN